jgi:hypothetical protein
MAYTCCGSFTLRMSERAERRKRYISSCHDRIIKYKIACYSHTIIGRSVPYVNLQQQAGNLWHCGSTSRKPGWTTTLTAHSLVIDVLFEVIH